MYMYSLSPIWKLWKRLTMHLSELELTIRNRRRSCRNLIMSLYNHVCLIVFRGGGWNWFNRCEGFWFSFVWCTEGSTWRICCKWHVLCFYVDGTTYLTAFSYEFFFITCGAYLIIGGALSFVQCMHEVLWSLHVYVWYFCHMLYSALVIIYMQYFFINKLY